MIYFFNDKYLRSKMRGKKMKDLTKGNPTRLLLIFAIPMLLGSVFQQFYNLADTRIVGHWRLSVLLLR